MIGTETSTTTSINTALNSNTPKTPSGGGTPKSPKSPQSPSEGKSGASDIHSMKGGELRKALRPNSVNNVLDNVQFFKEGVIKVGKLFWELKDENDNQGGLEEVDKQLVNTVGKFGEDLDSLNKQVSTEFFDEAYKRLVESKELHRNLKKLNVNMKQDKKEVKNISVQGDLKPQVEIWKDILKNEVTITTSIANENFMDKVQRQMMLIGEPSSPVIGGYPLCLQKISKGTKIDKTTFPLHRLPILISQGDSPNTKYYVVGIDKNNERFLREVPDDGVKDVGVLFGEKDNSFSQLSGNTITVFGDEIGGLSIYKTLEGAGHVPMPNDISRLGIILYDEYCNVNPPSGSKFNSFYLMSCIGQLPDLSYMQAGQLPVLMKMSVEVDKKSNKEAKVTYQYFIYGRHANGSYGYSKKPISYEFLDGLKFPESGKDVQQCKVEPNEELSKELIELRDEVVSNKLHVSETVEQWNKLQKEKYDRAMLKIRNVFKEVSKIGPYLGLDFKSLTSLAQYLEKSLFICKKYKKEMQQLNEKFPASQRVKEFLENIEYFEVYIKKEKLRVADCMRYVLHESSENADIATGMNVVAKKYKNIMENTNWYGQCQEREEKIQKKKKEVVDPQKKQQPTEKDFRSALQNEHNLYGAEDPIFSILHSFSKTGQQSSNKINDKIQSGPNGIYDFKYGNFIDNVGGEKIKTTGEQKSKGKERDIQSFQFSYLPTKFNYDLQFVTADINTIDTFKVDAEKFYVVTFQSIIGNKERVFLIYLDGEKKVKVEVTEGGELQEIWRLMNSIKEIKEEEEKHVKQYKFTRCKYYYSSNEEVIKGEDEDEWVKNKIDEAAKGIEKAQKNLRKLRRIYCLNKVVEKSVNYKWEDVIGGNDENGYEVLREFIDGKYLFSTFSDIEIIHIIKTYLYARVLEEKRTVSDKLSMLDKVDAISDEYLRQIVTELKQEEEEQKIIKNTAPVNIDIGIARSRQAFLGEIYKKTGTKLVIVGSKTQETNVGNEKDKSTSNDIETLKKESEELKKSLLKSPLEDEDKDSDKKSFDELSEIRKNLKKIESNTKKLNDLNGKGNLDDYKKVDPKETNKTYNDMEENKEKNKELTKSLSELNELTTKHKQCVDKIFNRAKQYGIEKFIGADGDNKTKYYLVPEKNTEKPEKQNLVLYRTSPNDKPRRVVIQDEQEVTDMFNYIEEQNGSSCDENVELEVQDEKFAISRRKFVFAKNEVPQKSMQYNVFYICKVKDSDNKFTVKYRTKYRTSGDGEVVKSIEINAGSELQNVYEQADNLQEISPSKILFEGGEIPENLQKSKITKITMRAASLDVWNQVLYHTPYEIIKSNEVTYEDVFEKFVEKDQRSNPEYGGIVLEEDYDTGEVARKIFSDEKGSDMKYVNVESGKIYELLYAGDLQNLLQYVNEVVEESNGDLDTFKRLVALVIFHHTCINKGLYGKRGKLVKEYVNIEETPNGSFNLSMDFPGKSPLSFLEVSLKVSELIAALGKGGHIITSTLSRKKMSDLGTYLLNINQKFTAKNLAVLQRRTQQLSKALADIKEHLLQIEKCRMAIDLLVKNAKKLQQDNSQEIRDLQNTLDFSLKKVQEVTSSMSERDREYITMQKLVEEGTKSVGEIMEEKDKLGKNIEEHEKSLKKVHAAEILDISNKIKIVEQDFSNVESVIKNVQDAVEKTKNKLQKEQQKVEEEINKLEEELKVLTTECFAVTVGNKPAGEDAIKKLLEQSKNKPVLVNVSSENKKYICFVKDGAQKLEEIQEKSNDGVLQPLKEVKFPLETNKLVPISHSESAGLSLYKKIIRPYAPIVFQDIEHIQEVQKKLKDLQDKLQVHKDFIQDVNSIDNSLKGKGGDLGASIKTCSKKLQQLSEGCDDELKSAKLELDEELRLKDNEKKKITEQCNELTKKLEQQEKKLTESQKRLEENSKLLESAMKEKEDVKMKQEKLEKEKEEIKKQIEEKEKQIKNLKNVNKEEKERLQKQFNEEKKQLQEKTENVVKEIEKVKIDRDDKNKKVADLEKQQKEKEDEILKVKKECDEKKKELEEKSTKEQELQKQLKEKSEKITKELEEINKNKDTHVKKIEETKKKIISGLGNIDIELESLIDVQKELSQKIEKSSEKNIESKVGIEDLEKSLKEGQESVKKLEENGKKLEEIFQKVDENLKKMDVEIQDCAVALGKAIDVTTDIQNITGFGDAYKNSRLAIFSKGIENVLTYLSTEGRCKTKAQREAIIKATNTFLSDPSEKHLGEVYKTIDNYSYDAGLGGRVINIFTLGLAFKFRTLLSSGGWLATKARKKYNTGITNYAEDAKLGQKIDNKELQEKLPTFVKDNVGNMEKLMLVKSLQEKLQKLGFDVYANQNQNQEQKSQKIDIVKDGLKLKALMTNDELKSLQSVYNLCMKSDSNNVSENFKGIKNILGKNGTESFKTSPKGKDFFSKMHDSLTKVEEQKLKFEFSEGGKFTVSRPGNSSLQSPTQNQNQQTATNSMLTGTQPFNKK